MNGLKRAIFNSLFVHPARLYRRLFLDLHVWGRENIPTGPKIYVTNHIACTDGAWVLPEFTEPVHVVIGPGYHLSFFAKMLDALEQINCMPAHRKTVVEKAVAYLKHGDSVYIAPEGDLQELFQLGKFYPGVARIYRETHVPIVPIALLAPYSSIREYPRLGGLIEGRLYRMVTVLRGTFCIKIGQPLKPEIPANMSDRELDETITAQIKNQIQSQLDQIRRHEYWCEPTGGSARKRGQNQNRDGERL